MRIQLNKGTSRAEGRKLFSARSLLGNLLVSSFSLYYSSMSVEDFVRNLLILAIVVNALLAVFVITERTSVCSLT